MAVMDIASRRGNDIILFLEGKRVSSQVHNYVAATVEDTLRCQ